jgi:hypothetical protein
MARQGKNVVVVVVVVFIEDYYCFDFFFIVLKPKKSFLKRSKTCGVMTTGGTESICMSILTHKKW